MCGAKMLAMLEEQFIDSPQDLKRRIWLTIENN